jgi:hypothetical protein
VSGSPPESGVWSPDVRELWAERLWGAIEIRLGSDSTTSMATDV